MDGAFSSESVLDQVSRILASPTFARSDRLGRFLRFTVEQTLDGRGEELKEYVLGVEVFDKEQDFDPRIDPIVRVEARRLRRYYEDEGRSDAILIDLPKGAYRPVFREAGGPEANTE